MQSLKVITWSRRIAAVGLLSCFCLFALTVTVHCHTAAADHVQHECGLCLIGVSSKAFVAPLAILPFYCEASVLCVVATPNLLSVPLWDNTSSRKFPLFV